MRFRNRDCTPLEVIVTVAAVMLAAVIIAHLLR
jgi:hypothetical protein